MCQHVCYVETLKMNTLKIHVGVCPWMPMFQRFLSVDEHWKFLLIGIVLENIFIRHIQQQPPFEEKRTRSTSSHDFSSEIPLARKKKTQPSESRKTHGHAGCCAWFWQDRLGEVSWVEDFPMIPKKKGGEMVPKEGCFFWHYPVGLPKRKPSQWVNRHHYFNRGPLLTFSRIHCSSVWVGPELPWKRCNHAFCAEVKGNEIVNGRLETRRTVEKWCALFLQTFFGDMILEENPFQLGLRRVGGYVKLSKVDDHFFAFYFVLSWFPIRNQAFCCFSGDFFGMRSLLLETHP